MYPVNTPALTNPTHESDPECTEMIFEGNVRPRRYSFDHQLGAESRIPNPEVLIKSFYILKPVCTSYEECTEIVLDGDTVVVGCASVRRVD